MESNMTSLELFELNAHGDAYDPFVSYGDPFGDDDENDLMNTQIPIDNNFLDEFDSLMFNDVDDRQLVLEESGNDAEVTDGDNKQNRDDNLDDVFKNDADENLPRIQVELDKLNYSNESINNLELELEVTSIVKSKDLVDMSLSFFWYQGSETGICAAFAGIERRAQWPRSAVRSVRGKSQAILRQFD
jgi:hypothetical protein